MTKVLSTVLLASVLTLCEETPTTTVGIAIAAATDAPITSTLVATTSAVEAGDSFLNQLGNFLGLEASADDDDLSGDKELQWGSSKTCASFKKCTKCVANSTCNWCDKAKTCAENSRPDTQCPTKSDYTTSKWHCPDHLKWWGVLLIVIACVCCCPLISALCFFFVIKKFCCGD